MDNEWKDTLRERFSDYSVPEPAGLWEGIEQGMAAKPRRKMLPVWLVSGVAAAAAVALVVFLHPGTGSQIPAPGRMESVALAEPADTVDATAIPETPAVVPDEPVAVPAGTDFGVAFRRTLLADAAEAVAVGQEDTVSTIDGMKIYSGEHPALRAVVPVTPVDAEKVIQSIMEAMKKQVGDQKSSEAEDAPDEPASFDPEERAALRKRFSVGAYREGGQNASGQSQGFGLSQTGEYLTRSSEGEGSMDLGRMMRMLSANRASTYTARHHAPVRTGVSFAWELTPHLSLATGLDWTSLSSSFEETTAGSTQTVIQQNLGYLGIPLRLEAGFEPVRRLRLYAGAGGMVEKGLLATSRTHSYIGDHHEGTVTGHPDTGGLLWSVGATAGAEYRFSRTFGVYFAPGLEYHFDNGSEVRSAYTEKPLSWNLSFGVRFHVGRD